MPTRFNRIRRLHFIFQAGFEQTIIIYYYQINDKFRTKTGFLTCTKKNKRNNRHLKKINKYISINQQSIYIYNIKFICVYIIIRKSIKLFKKKTTKNIFWSVTFFSETRIKNITAGGHHHRRRHRRHHHG